MTTNECQEILRMATQRRADVGGALYLHVNHESVVKIISASGKMVGLMSPRFTEVYWGREIVTELFLLADNDVNAL